MGMTEVDTTKVDNNLGIIYGSDSAPVTIIEYINLRCPYCKQWWDERSPLIDKYVAEGKVKQVIKLFDKEKESLQRGNVMHQYVPNNMTAKEAIAKIYDTQDQWGDLSLDGVAEFAVNKLGLDRQPETESMTKKIAEECKENGVFFIPTMVINDHVFDQKISDEDLVSLLEKK
ncbi:thioredoxin domain-containing protein [Vagococcus vulneris]|nr:thioredoxin domain-containing protein [Vagococcus vulneris]